MNLPIIKKCGECTACCDVLGVKELKKDAYAKCAFVCDKGCGVYRLRPKECADYTCFWLQSDLPDFFRPNICGVILEMQITDIGICIVLREIRPDSVEIIMDAVEEIAKNFNAYIYICRPNNREIIFPPWCEHLRDKVQQFVDVDWRGVKHKIKIHEN